MKVDTSGWTVEDHIVLAVSTGVDSMCLLYALTHLYRDTYRKLTCLHVNHGLREESIEEERFFQTYCEQHQLSYDIKHLDLSHLVASGKSIQNDSRQMRYQWFDYKMHELNADVLLTAHHLDDQLETIFYRLFSGRATRSRLGMSYLTAREQYKICRPLLQSHKQDIRYFQQVHHVPFYEDCSNHINKYVRNDIRNRLIPEINDNEQLDVEQLLKLKAWHDAQMEQLENKISRFIQDYVNMNHNHTMITCPRTRFNRLPYYDKVMLMDCLLQYTDIPAPYSERTYHEWFHQIANDKAQFEIGLTEQWHIKIAYDKFIIMAKYQQQTSVEPIKIYHHGHYHFGNSHIIVDEQMPADVFPLTIRTRKNGDIFCLNGQTAHKKVSRLMIDHKVDMNERNIMPIVVDAEQHIIAVGQLYISRTHQDYLTINNGDE
ncbi:tRNA lysidine(34) synthetase TilS [Staphylococcus lugdunensis]|uniref:tRNA(Ile)-lysidine synthase n=1 Tax=Staphylococcus lugdunensis TaxID=28035 RepID=A0A133PZN5_STALU|nr:MULTISPECIES: tRNA lysidine(34) synthetase TilS [Staphylococcus]AMG61498.1 tRNA(Ile)-lysidine synthetase [Staphylococcus lugdunensis]ARB78599.1 tRNA lysidine(34) synthetase TilS [Staphylococcus lugdunensis]ARJ12320.1 tRNA lysidine(34) synthetase TilS [Staphylococcus lugdunensis]ARJ19728.1 tRNA lysidine(34) synthetase TilS [Staphylococcus lugdunensis]AST61518.1 tRNA lysidine(34) synthetase TilS [Staphylococcus lugdunensis]